VRASARSVNNKDFGKRELDASRQTIDFGFEIAVGKWGEFVEPGLYGGNEEEHDELETHHKHPDPEEEVGTTPLNDF
jgi:hypothetical protein